MVQILSPYYRTLPAIDRMPGFNDREGEQKKVYHELSLYAHPSATQLDLESAPEPPIGYNGSDFQACIKLMLEVTALMLAVAPSRGGLNR